MEATEAGGNGGERGEPEAMRPQKDPFNPAESDRLGGSVVAHVLEVSEHEGEGTSRMVVAGGQRQPVAPNVPAAAMRLILPVGPRKEEGKCRQGLTGVGAVEGGGSGVRPGGQRRTRKEGKGHVGAPGAKKTAGHQEGKAGKGGGQGHQWPQPQQSLRQLPPGSPPQVSAAVRAEEERVLRHQQTGRYKALARMEHQRCRRQALTPGPKTIYRLEMGIGGGRSEHQEEQEGTGVGAAATPVADHGGGGRTGWAGRGCSSGVPWTAGGRKGEWEEAKRAGMSVGYRVQEGKRKEEAQ